MKKILTLVLLLLGASTGLIAQEKIELSETNILFFKLQQFEKCNIRLLPDQLEDAVMGVDKAEVLAKKAAFNHDMYDLVNGVGTFLVLYPIIENHYGREPEWTYAYVGGGMILSGILFKSWYKKNAKLAVDVYNRENGFANSSPIKSMQLGITNHGGFGLTVGLD